MPVFQYEALNEAGKGQKGTVTANSSEDAIARIRGGPTARVTSRRRSVWTGGSLKSRFAAP